MPRVIDFDLRIDWSFTGSFQDESSRLVAANGSVRLAAPESGITSPRGTVDQCTLTLDNRDGRYSPLNTSSPLYAYIQGGGAYHAPMFLRVSIDGGATYARVFTGVIKIPSDQPPVPGTAGLTTVDCRSRDELLLNKRMSTPIDTFRQLHNEQATEAEIIVSFLVAAGLSASDYIIDPGLFVIPWAWLDDESPLTDIWQMAAACGGRFYCDQDGTFRYENMMHWLFAPHTVSQETITEDGYGAMDGPTYDDRELYSSVTVVASPRSQLAAGEVWASSQIISVPQGETITVLAKLRQPAYTLDSIGYTAVTGGATNITPWLTITTQQFAQRCEISIENSHPVDAGELIDLHIIGTPVSGEPTIEETYESEHAFWSSFASARPGRNRLIQQNPYIQSVGQAKVLAEFLRDRYQLPRLSYKLRQVPGKPTRRLGDRITVSNAEVMTGSRQAFITAIDWRLSERGFIQDVELYDAENLYPYGAPGQENYFILGSSTLGNNLIASDAVLFY